MVVSASPAKSSPIPTPTLAPSPTTTPLPIPLAVPINNHTPTGSEHKSVLREAAELLLCSAGIYICFISYGILQENMYKKEWGPDKVKFDHSLFLVFFQCMGNALFALVLGIFSKSGRHMPATAFIKISFSYIGAMFLSNSALSYMSYPAQALAKSCKLIPVMIMRIFVNGKRYTLREYMQVALITLGICVFMLAENTSSSKKTKETSWLGLALCLASLALDGYTGPTQEKMNEEYNPSMAQMMFYLNFWAILVVATALLVTGQMWTGIAFCQAYPAIVPEAMLFGLLSAMGQAFIILTLLTFNSLVVTTVTTTRKFFTILASVMYYGHQLNIWQWNGVGLVFAGLGLEIYYKYQAKQSHHKQHHAHRSGHGHAHKQH